MTDFVIEYRYNRAKYHVSYDTNGGTAIPARVLYYGQTIPSIENPTKRGAEFVGWKSSKDIKYIGADGQEKLVKAGGLIPNMQSEFKEGMPAEDVRFTAVWEENETAEYRILFYSQKPDITGDEPDFRERYDCIGAKL